MAQTIFHYICLWILGAQLGSFCNAFAWRMVRHRSIIKGRSACPHCGHILGAAELIPVLSWLMQRGKCRSCGAAISYRYPLIELLTAFIFLSLAMRYEQQVQLLTFLVLGCLLLLAALVDYESWRIPDGIIITGVLLYLPLQSFGESINFTDCVALLWRGCSVATPLFLLIFAAERICRQTVMGGGDIKLFFLLGVYLGPLLTALTLFIACLVGLFWQCLRYKRDWRQPFPFGPAIAAATWLALLWGEPLIKCYFKMLL